MAATPFKNWGSLAYTAYQAYCKQAQEMDTEGLAGHVPGWYELDEGTQVCWLAVVHQLWAEFSVRPVNARALLLPEVQHDMETKL